MDRFFVYALVDPRDGSPFYVGKGCGDRPRKHLTESLERTDNVRKHYKIQSLRTEGVEPEIRKVREGLSDEEAFALEEAEILRYGRKGIEPNGILTNLTLGSRPPTRLGRLHSEETKQKIRDAALGREKSPEHRAAISRNKSGPNNHMWGKPVPEDRKEKIRQGNLGKKRSDSVRKNMATAHAVKYEIVSPQGKKRVLDSLQLQKLCDTMGLNKTAFVNACRAGRTYKGWAIKRM